VLRRIAAIPPGLRYMAEGVLYFSTMAMLVKLVSERIPTNEIVLARTGVTFVLSSVALYRLRIRPREGPRSRRFRSERPR
jgi:hypothetical protein